MQPTPPAPPAPPSPPPVAESEALYAQLQAQAEAVQMQAKVQQLAGQIAGGAPAGRAMPRTAQELAGLRRQREELSNQLQSAQRRRRDVAQALERANDPANRAGLEGRLRVLDQRIAPIESDISETGRLITTAPPALFATSQVPPPFRDFDRGPPKGAVAIMFILFVLFPMVLMIGRAAVRRSAGAPTRPEPLQRESAERLARLEQAVEAIAIEVERVSEGQRFVTRLLADSRGAPAAGAAQEPHDTHDALPRYAGNG